MIWFWIIVAFLVLVALAALLRPLLSPTPHGGGNEATIALFRRQLADIDRDHAQGRLPLDEASAARAELTRRLLAETDREDRESDLAAVSPTELSWRIGAALGMAGLLPAAALAVYFAVGTPAAIDSPATASASRAAETHDLAELAAAAEKLKARLERDPDHPEGWALLGRTLTRLGRYADARDAYDRAIGLKPDDAQLHAELGEVLVLGARGMVTSAALSEFAKSANDPRARFYGAEAALQRGDTDEAKAALQALLADAPVDAPWRQIVAARLAEIAPDAAEAGSKTPAGPSARDIAAAQSMSPEERQAMIRSMVERLAARLEQNPGDKEGWGRLAHAYEVLGDTDKAQTARARAAAVGAPATR